MLDRCSYQPSDIQLNEKFRPVVRRASDGMLTVNFAAFDLLSSSGVPHTCATVVAAVLHHAELGLKQLAAAFLNTVCRSYCWK